MYIIFTTRVIVVKINFIKFQINIKYILIYKNLTNFFRNYYNGHKWIKETQ